jgi:DNA polymerase-3 subunit delta
MDLLKDIRAGRFAPVYLLMGDEPFFVDRIVKALETGVLNEADQAFNQMVVYGKEVTVQQVVSEARQFPMMGDRRVVIVKEAQGLNLGGKSGDDESEEDEEETAGGSVHLLNYCLNPQPSTVLVIAIKGKSIRKDSKIVKAALANGGVYFKSEKLRDSDISGWVKELAGLKKMPMQEEAVLMIAENIGNDIGRIFNEFEKLEALLPEGATVTREIVEKHIGISRDYNVFELTRAINAGDVRKAYTITDYYALNSKTYPIQMLIPTLAGNFFRLLKLSRIENPTADKVAKELKINPFFAQEYMRAARLYPTKRVMHCISLLREYDMRSKGVETGGADSGELLREMMLRILT